jgi:hypothetical protein
MASVDEGLHFLAENEGICQIETPSTKLLPTTNANRRKTTALTRKLIPPFSMAEAESSADLEFGICCIAEFYSADRSNLPTTIGHFKRLAG